MFRKARHVIIVAIVTLGLALAALPVATVAADGSSLLRVVHASPGAASVEVFVDGRKAVSSLQFAQASSYSTVPAGTHQVAVFSSGASSGAKPEMNATVNLLAGQAYTVVAADVVTKMSPMVLPDALSAPPAGKAVVRLVHASPDAPRVADIALAGGPVLFHNVAFKAATTYLPVAPGTYRFEVRPAGTTLALATTDPITVDADHTYSVFALGELADGSFKAVAIADNARGGGVGVPPGSGGGGMSRGQVVRHSALILGGLLAILAVLVALRSVLVTSPHRRG